MKDSHIQQHDSTTKGIRHFVGRTLLFALVACVGYILLLCLFGDLGWARTGNFKAGNQGHIFTRMKEAREYHDIDVLFLGSSHCYRTFDTRFYEANGIHCYNLGSSNQSPIQTRVLLDAYLDSLHPKFVVFEVHDDIMRNDGVESAVDMLINVPITAEASKMAWGLKNMKVLNTWAYSLYNQKVMHRLDNFVEDSVIFNFRHVRGGFLENDSCNFVKRNYARKDLTIQPKQLKALKQCLAMLDEHNIPYLLVETQDALQYRKSVKNHEWFEKQMSALGPYYYEVLPLVDTLHFFDSYHFNKEGVRIFNEHFINILRKQLDKRVPAFGKQAEPPTPISTQNQ
mgnify:CR=1 FL=1